MKIENKTVVETTFHVRYAETDQMGVVHHSVYPIWFEEGRSHWMRAMGSNYAEYEAQGLILSVSELHVRYHRPARYGMRIAVRTRIDSVRSRGMEVSYEVVDFDTDTLLATGTTRHISLDRRGGVVRIPESWQKFLSSSTTDSEPGSTENQAPAK